MVSRIGFSIIAFGPWWQNDVRRHMPSMAFADGGGEARAIVRVTGSHHLSPSSHLFWRITNEYCDGMLTRHVNIIGYSPPAVAPAPPYGYLSLHSNAGDSVESELFPRKRYWVLFGIIGIAAVSDEVTMKV
nr:hypothetical protein Iba_chr04aCG4270 [Ipomoea batatas]